MMAFPKFDGLFKNLVNQSRNMSDYIKLISQVVRV